MRLAIATNTLGAASETFVERHIRCLNGGETVVLCRRLAAQCAAPDRPTLMLHNSRAPVVESVRQTFRAVWNQLRWGGIALPSPAKTRQIANFLREQDVRCILAEFGPMGCIMSAAARQCGLPLFVYFRGRDASTLLRRRTIREAYGHLFTQATGVFAVSDFLLQRLREANLSHPNSHVIPSGVDTRLFRPAEQKDANLILFVGRFVPKKSPDLVIRAFAQARQAAPALKLTMIGDGPLLAPCRRLAAALRLGDSVRFEGAQTHAVVRDHMERAAIFVQHSVTSRSGETEGLPSTIQEAMSAQCLVIATPHAGIPEAISSGQNGILIPDRDRDRLAESIRHMSADREQAGRLARQARQDAISRFDATMLMRRLEHHLLQPSTRQCDRAPDHG